MDPVPSPVIARADDTDLIPRRLPVWERPAARPWREVLLGALLAFALFRALVLPALVRAQIERSEPRLRFEKLTLSVFRGTVLLEDVVLLDEDGRPLVGARSARARLSGQHVELEELSLQGEAAAMTSRVKVDRVVLERGPSGELRALEATGRILDFADEPVADARVALERDGDSRQENVRFEASARLHGGEELGTVRGDLHLGEEHEGGTRPVHLEMASPGGSFRASASFILTRDARASLSRRALDGAAEHVREAAHAVQERVQELKKDARALLGR